MRCPNCAHEMETPQMRWQRQQRARGSCIACGKATEKYAKCLSCRRKDALRRRRHRNIDHERLRIQRHAV